MRPAALLFALTACGSGPSDATAPTATGDDDDNTNTGPGTTPPNTGQPFDGGTLAITDANNYGFTSTMAVQSMDVQRQYDAAVDWSGLTTDVIGRPLTIDDVDRVFLLRLDLSEQAIFDKLALCDFEQSDTEWLYEWSDSATSMSFSDLSILGNAFDPAQFTESGDVYLLTLWQTIDDFDVLLTSLFLVPTVTGSQVVAVDTNSMTWDFDADLQSAQTVTAQAGATYTLDWSAITAGAGGLPLNPFSGTQAFVAHF